MEKELLSFLDDIFKLVVVPIIFTFVGYLFGKRQLKDKIKLDFIERQLREFFAVGGVASSTNDILPQ